MQVKNNFLLIFFKTTSNRLVNSSVNIYGAKNLLRHSTVKVTERYYTKVSLDRLGEEAEKIWSR